MGLLTSIPQNVMNSLINYFSSRYQTIFKSTNTASGTTSATLNKTSGVVTFSTNVAAYPSFTQYVINNSLVTTTSIIEVFVYTDSEDTYFVTNGIYRGGGQIIVTLNDGGIAIPCPPTIGFRILN